MIRVDLRGAVVTVSVGDGVGFTVSGGESITLSASIPEVVSVMARRPTGGCLTGWICDFEIVV